MQFLSGHHLNAAIEDIIRSAESELLIVSPYIKLHERTIEALKTLIDKPKVRVTLIFGKASGDKTTTFDKDSIAFLKTLPNIEIAHRQNLHAKFYANEDSSTLCSLNLYNYSQDVNFEAGYLINSTSSKANKLEQDEAWGYFNEIFDGAELMFDKEAEFESRLLRAKKYISSKVIFDALDNLPKDKAKPESKVKVKVKAKMGPTGSCIVSGTVMRYNIEKPLCRAEYRLWLGEGGDKDYSMKYCHFSGALSKGKTTFSKPILHKHWQEASQISN
jgi:phosphatidylserine/phosphatidylglycerophosphate/cardiolipin synthase-like enzyme